MGEIVERFQELKTVNDYRESLFSRHKMAFLHVIHSDYNFLNKNHTRSNQKNTLACRGEIFRKSQCWLWDLNPFLQSLLENGKLYLLGIWTIHLMTAESEYCGLSEKCFLQMFKHFILIWCLVLGRCSKKFIMTRKEVCYQRKTLRIQHSWTSNLVPFFMLVKEDSPQPPDHSPTLDICCHTTLP